MYLRFLGRGSGFTDEHTSAYFVTVKRDLFLLDCPTSTFVKVADLYTYRNFFVIITHTHGDHVGGLGLWTQYCFFVLKKKLTILVPSEEVRKDIDTLLVTIEGCKTDWYNIFVINPEYCYSDNLYIEPILTKHSPQLDGKSFGYQIEHYLINEKNVFYDQHIFIYTGDTSTLDPFERFFCTCSELYVDVSVFHGEMHLKLEDVLPRLIELAKSGIKVYLMHLDDAQAAEKMIAGIPGIEIVTLS